MSLSKWITATLAALATSGALLVCGADDSQLNKGNSQRVAKPPWAKTLAAWKAQRTSDPADNSYCDVCHVNYQDEKLTATHRRAGVGCETCHGVSDKHSEDEDGVTPPELMYPKSRIIAFCTTCHDKNELLKEDAGDSEKHADLFSKKADPKVNCATCHAKKHHLKVRTRRWDKKTGKLIWSDGVRMMEERPKAGLSDKDHRE